MRTKIAASLLSLSVAAVGLSACSASNAGEPNPDVLKLGVPPGEADPEFLEQMDPIAADIAEATGKEVEVTKTSDYLAVVEAIRSGLLDVALFSPMPTVVAQSVADVDPLVAALGAPYSTLIICDPDAGVTELADVADHTMAFVDPGSTSGNYIPRLMLQRAGVDLDELDETFAGGHDVSALSVKQGSTDCAAVASLLLPNLIESGTIDESDYEVVAESDPIPISMVIIARGDLADGIKQQITDKFLDEQSAEILEISRAEELVAAEDADWSLFEDSAEELGIELEETE